MDKKISIAIDGPAGAGKTTVAREVARRLGYKYVDTGAMYRAVAWKAIRRGISLSDEDAIVHIAGSTAIDFDENDDSRILVDGRDVSTVIRSPEVTKMCSPVSAIPGVRRYLVERQRQLAGNGEVVMEGRDIGSVVLPHAEVKVFLTASVEERAWRRHKEMKNSGVDVDIETVRQEIEERDRRDSTRRDSPLVRADDAIVVDTDGLSAMEAAEQILILCKHHGISAHPNPD